MLCCKTQGALVALNAGHKLMRKRCYCVRILGVLKAGAQGLLFDDAQLSSQAAQRTTCTMVKSQPSPASTISARIKSASAVMRTMYAASTQGR